MLGLSQVTLKERAFLNRYALEIMQVSTSVVSYSFQLPHNALQCERNWCIYSFSCC